MALTQAQEQAISQVDKQGIEVAFQNVFPYLQNGNWLDVANMYRVDLRNALRQAINQQDFAEYVAVSVLLHCADGWTYLGRAIASAISGDPDTARHLGYYAELRAAISLLASEGIAIINTYQYILNPQGRFTRLPQSRRRNNQRYYPGTHEITWLVLEYWSQLPQAITKISNSVQPESISLQDWLQGFAGGAFRLPIASDWFSTWGIDLQRLSQDHFARNQASYQPNRLENKNSLNPKELTGFLRNMWEVFRPGYQSRFNEIDKHLLRMMLPVAANAIGIRAGQIPVGITRMLGAVFPGQAPLLMNEWEAFFNRNISPQDPQLFSEASVQAPPTDPRHHIHVISRAALLLRFATGACNDLITTANYDSNDLLFWWRSLGDDLGLWTRSNRPSSNPGDILSIWEDVEDALDNLEKWEGTVTNPTYGGWGKKKAYPLRVLGSTERIGLWGIIP